MAKVQQWLGHANISTTRIYDTGGTGAACVQRTRRPSRFATEEIPPATQVRVGQYAYSQKIISLGRWR